MAHEYEIDGFCYYHYWFDNNKQELELPFNNVLKMGEPNFPFMLCWVNESCHAKFEDMMKNTCRAERFAVRGLYSSFFHLLEVFQIGKNDIGHV